MLLIAPGDAVATPRSRRSQHRSAQAEFIETAQRGELVNVTQPQPMQPCFEDSPAGRLLFAWLIVATIATAAHQFGWL